MKLIKSLIAKFKILNFEKQLKPLIKDKKYIFFFPYVHVGGGERVHIDILKLFDKKETLCFITNNSNSRDFQPEFEKYSEVVILEDFVSNERFRDKFKKAIASQINTLDNPTVFGSNNFLFYRILPFLRPDIIKNDLTHAITYENPDAIEKISLPFIKFLTNRILLGERAKKDLIEIYNQNNIGSSEIEKLKIIKNKVTTNNENNGNNNGNCFVYVGRSTHEKRPELLFKIIEEVNRKEIDTHFTIVGDFSKYQKQFSNSKNITFTGELKDKSKLDAIYKSSNYILLTSIREGMPMVLLEAMSFGVVPITTDVGEINEVINSKNQNGYLITSHDDENLIANDFVSTIENVLKDDSYNLFSKNAIETVKQKFSEETFKKEYHSIIKYE